jgi:hypothetical protein
MEERLSLKTFANSRGRRDMVHAAHAQRILVFDWRDEDYPYRSRRRAWFGGRQPRRRVEYVSTYYRNRVNFHDF